MNINKKGKNSKNQGTKDVKTKVSKINKCFLQMTTHHKFLLAFLSS